MNLYEMFSSDATLEAQGVWFPVGTARFLVARAGGANEAYAKELAKAFAPFQSILEAGAMPEGDANKLFATVFAETVIKDWEGVTDKNGQALEYSKEACAQMLVALPSLFQLIRAFADKLSTYQKKALEGAAKN